MLNYFKGPSKNLQQFVTVFHSALLREIGRCPGAINYQQHILVIHLPNTGGSYQLYLDNQKHSS